MSEGGQIFVKLEILDKEYRVACSPQERGELLASAQLLGDRIREIRKRGSIIGTERIAVMAALNMAHELLRLSQGNQGSGGHNHTTDKRLDGLREKIENALRESETL